MKISNTSFNFFILMLAVFALGSMARGQLMVEDFSYTPATSLNGQGGWSAHSGVGTNAPQITSGGLSYAGYPSSGIGNAASFTTNGEDNNKPFSSFPGGTTSGSIYYSLMVKIDSAGSVGDYFFHLYKSSTIFSARIFARRAANGNLRFGIGRASTIGNINFSDSIYAPGSTNLLVVKYTVLAGATNDTVALWVNPILGAPEPTPTVLESSADRATADVDTIYGVALRQGTAANASIGQVDGIRVDTVWAFGATGGPLTGTKTIPSDYATLAAAIRALDSLGVGTGGVTFNVASGYTETAPDSGYRITATGTASNQIVFQKSGGGPNPTFTASPTLAVGALNDAIIKIIGGDYITINGFTLLENAANTVTVAATNNMTEFGVGLFYASTVDGAHNNTIRNCTITLNRIYQNTFGIYSNVRHNESAVTVAADITDPAGSNSNLKIYSNTISNVNTGICVVGSLVGANMDAGLSISDGTGLASGNPGNTITNYGTTGTFSAYVSVNASVNGIYLNNQQNFNVSNNSIASSDGGTTAGTLRGIYVQTTGTLPTSGSFTRTINNNTIALRSAVAAGAMLGIADEGGNLTTSFTINNNNFNNTTHTVAASGAITLISNTGAALTQSISNNTFTNLTVNTTGSVTFISNTNSNASATGVKNVNSNSIVTSFTKTGAGGTVLFFTDDGVDANGVTGNCNNNTFSTISATGATAVTGISYTNGSTTGPTKSVAGNTVSNITGGTGTITGITTNFDVATTTVSGNNVNNIINGGTIIGISSGTSGAGTVNALQNTVHTLTGSGTGAVTGISIGGATASTKNFSRNKVYNLQNSNAAGTANGITVASGTTVSVYNNLVGDLRAPVASAATDAIRGINVTSATATSNVNVSFNSVYLNATSSGINFSSSGVFHTTSATATTAVLNLRNNVIVNTSTPAGTGVTSAYRRSTTALTNYGSASNNNLFYAGTPSAASVIFYDGTNTDQTLAAFKSRVSPRETFSVTENPPFLSTTGTSSNFLHVNTTIATQTESGGVPVAGITDDFDGDTRNVSTPDLGADEFAGVILDVNPPAISYTPLGNTSLTAARTLNATITDVSGVPTTGTGLPRLYWKKNSGSFTGVTATSLGGNGYSFILGSGVVVGDTVSYYTVAQDGATPPNVGAQPSTGATGFTADPPTAATPPTTPSSYLIVPPPLSGDYTVGTALFNRLSGHHLTFEPVTRRATRVVLEPEPQVERRGDKSRVEPPPPSGIVWRSVLKEVEVTEWVPMENGTMYSGRLSVISTDNSNTVAAYPTITAAINDLNLRGVSGPVRFLLTDGTYPTETFPITVNVLNDSVPTVIKTVTIKPNTGVTASVSGAAAATVIFKVLSNYVTIDGSNTNGGVTRDLTIENTSITTPSVVWFGSIGTTPITNGMLKNCIIRNGVNTGTAVAITDGTVLGNAGFFSTMTVQNNSVQKAFIGVYSSGGTIPQNGSNLNYSQNDVNSTGADAVRTVGLYMQGINGATVTQNNVANFDSTTSENDIGVWLASGTINATVSNNTVSSLILPTVAAFSPIGINVTPGVASANNVITQNTISNLRSNGNSSTNVVTGISVTGASGSITLEKNNIQSIKNVNPESWPAIGINLNGGSNNIVRNNFVANVANDQTAGTGAFSPTFGATGIRVNAGTGHQVYFNSVNHYGPMGGIINTNLVTGIAVATTALTGIDIRNNVLSNSMTGGNPAGTRFVGIFLPSGATSTMNLTLNNSAYFQGADTNSRMAQVGTTFGTGEYLAANFHPDSTTPSSNFRAYTSSLSIAGTNDNASVATSTAPPFISNTNLHIDSTQTPLVVSNAGTSIAGITTDIDGQTRNATTPDIGADEFGSPAIPGLNGLYTVGTGGQFPTLDSAFAALMSQGVVGPVTLSLTDSVYAAPERPARNNQSNVSRHRDALLDPLDPLAMRQEGQPRTLGGDNPDIVAVSVTGPIPGVSATNRVTVRPANNVQARIVGTGAATFDFLNVSYVTFDGIATTGPTQLTIENTATNGIAIALTGNSDNNIMRNLTLRSLYASGVAVYVDTASGASPDSMIVSGSRIPSSQFAIYVRGGNFISKGNQITNNVIGSDSIGAVGIYNQQVNGGIIANNYIQNVKDAIAAGGNIAGMWTATKQLNMQVYNNVVNSVRNRAGATAAVFAAGIYHFGTAGDSSKSIYYNNMVYGVDNPSTSAAATVRGMYLSTGIRDVAVYNTVSLTGADGGSIISGALYASSASVNLTLQNNIALNARVATGTGRAMGLYLTATPTGLTSNYNDLYVPTQSGSNVAAIGATNYATLAAWQATGRDSQSVSVAATFRSPDLHVDSTVATPINAGATPFAGVTSDIDGQARNVSTPDIGADEFTVVTFPPPVVSNVARSTRVPAQGDTVVVTCTITDTLGIATANILYASDGVAQTPVAMTRTSGTPTNGTYRGVLPGSANLNGKRIEYRIQANSSTGNNTTTIVAAANSYFAGLSPLSLTGVKSVGPNRALLYRNYYARVTGTVNGPNYQTTSISYFFQDAVGGIDLFKAGTLTPALALGDSIIVLGKLDQFNGLTELTPDTVTVDIVVVATGRPVTAIPLTMVEFNANPELYESRLIRLSSIQRRDATPPWPNLGGSANIVVYQTVVTDTVIMRIDSDTEIDGSTEPTYPVNIIGIAGQFSTPGVFDNGYQIQPRYLGDFSAPAGPGWTAQTSGITNQFYSVKAINSNVAWAAAVGGRVLRTVDGGATWTSVGGGRIGTADIYNITAVDANIAFVTTTPSTTTYIFRTTNGGAQWDTVYSLAGGFIDALHMYDAANGIAMGDPVGGKYVILRTTNGGTSWARIATEPTPGAGEASSQNDLSVVGASNIWFGASANGRIYRSTDAGATWLSSTIPGAVAASNVIAVWFNSPQYGIASSVNGTTYTAYRSTDGGATWTAVTVGTAGYNIAVSGSGTDDFWMARGTDVYRSTNRGTTWTQSYTGTGTFYDVDFITSGSSTYGWGVKDNGNIVFAFFTVTGVNERTPEIPQAFNLMQNYPNPFNPSTTFRYGLPKNAHVAMKIYNMLGQEVITLRDEFQSVGFYDVVWNGRNAAGAQIASGVYFYSIMAKPTDGSEAFTSIKKMLMLK